MKVMEKQKVMQLFSDNKKQKIQWRKDNKMIPAQNPPNVLKMYNIINIQVNTTGINVQVNTVEKVEQM